MESTSINSTKEQKVDIEEILKDYKDMDYDGFLIYLKSVWTVNNY